MLNCVYAKFLDSRYLNQTKPKLRASCSVELVNKGYGVFLMQQQLDSAVSKSQEKCSLDSNEVLGKYPTLRSIWV